MHACSIGRAELSLCLLCTHERWSAPLSPAPALFSRCPPQQPQPLAPAPAAAAYPALVTRWVQRNWPGGANHTFTNNGLSGTTSGLAASCTDVMVPTVSPARVHGKGGSGCACCQVADEPFPCCAPQAACERRLRPPPPPASSPEGPGRLLPWACLPQKLSLQARHAPRGKARPITCSLCPTSPFPDTRTPTW